MSNDWVYDTEEYPNVFTITFEHAEAPFTLAFEISEYRDQSKDLLEFLKYLVSCNARLIGFNNLAWDYPILHLFLRNSNVSAAELYQKAQSLIQSENKFEGMVFPSDRVIPQIDLYRIWHFDNKAKATSLKALEYQMRMDNISDLPFPVGSTLNPEQIKVLLDYNLHDVRATKEFYHESLNQIRFREELTTKYGRDFLNHNDTKIGAEIFQIELEKAGVVCYVYGKEGRSPRQTKRDHIALKDCVPQWVEFRHPEFQRIKSWFNEQIVTETKGVFKKVIAKVGGLDFVYGTGGLHASVKNRMFVADEEMMILDVDVTSLYPSIAIEYSHYPEHLGPRFVEVYRELRTQRLGYAKNTAENAMLKLALNGTYGKSNDKYSIFYDPKFTMTITLTGQMVISLLAEWLLTVDRLQIIQVNTDGVTLYLPRSAKDRVMQLCKAWEAGTRLQLEYVEYQKMVIRDVNNYIAQKLNGDVKRKGAYEWDKEWHQDSSASVVPRVAEQVLIYGKPLEQTVREWSDRMDFMIRVKVPRSSRLIYINEEGEQSNVGNIQRYYISPEGGTLLKVMPPLKGKTDNRWFDVQKNWRVCLCNDIKDATLPIDYRWYIEEVRKLCLSATSSGK